MNRVRFTRLACSWHINRLSKTEPNPKNRPNERERREENGWHGVTVASQQNSTGDCGTKMAYKRREGHIRTGKFHSRRAMKLGLID